METTALSAIRGIDYSVIFVRDMPAMRHFYAEIMGFALLRMLSPTWIEYRVGPNVLALAVPRILASEPPVPPGTAALQLAFRVNPAEVDACAAVLASKGVVILSPPTDRDFGHRTMFFRDPDGNLLEIYAEIPPAQ
jgi:catechol 2,3-dioxygenase-like lactoylglutathione lyase family enzyme